MIVVLALFSGAAVVDNSHKVKVKSPVKKVVEMLSDMLAKGKKEKQDEMVRFAAYKQFCESTAAEKSKNIATAKEEIDQLSATIAKAQADVAEITKYVAGLDSDVATWSDDFATNNAERKKALAEFTAAQKEYIASIDAVDRAMGMLKKGGGGGKIAQLLQLNKGSILALLQSGDRTSVKSL